MPRFIFFKVFSCLDKTLVEFPVSFASIFTKVVIACCGFCPHFFRSFVKISPGRCGVTGTTRSGRVARGGVGGLGYGADPRAGTVSFILFVYCDSILQDELS